MAQLTDRLPVAENDFARLIDNHLVYVDKTDLIADLAGRKKAFFFLARPRGFGKTLLLSTFEELFKNGRGRFKGLKLEKDEPWVDDGVYKVIRLDLSNNENDDSKKLCFEDCFVSSLAEAFNGIGAQWGNQDYWVLNFEQALEQLGQNELVLLIDNYDAPLTSVLDDQDEHEKRRKALYLFFATLKSFSKKFRFVFITARTGFHGHGVMANNVCDLSFDPDLGAVAGFTQSELEQNFKPYIARAAKVLAEKDPQGHRDEQKVLEAIKQCCSGFSFDVFAGHEAYNPRAVIDFLARSEDGFKNSRLESGGSAGPVCSPGAD